jgi:hypothetical protein
MQDGIKMLIKLFLLVSLIISFSSFCSEFPLGPDETLTPGQLCQHPDSYRYPEHIAYCRRDVHRSLKDQIFQNYRNLGFYLNKKKRRDYKIDHYIPLCAGGSNSIENLWPQHRSVYLQTDMIESVGCEKLKAGLISQSAFVALVKEAKNNLERAADILARLKAY